jgi:hypothetical protein
VTTGCPPGAHGQWGQLEGRKCRRMHGQAPGHWSKSMSDRVDRRAWGSVARLGVCVCEQPGEGVCLPLLVAAPPCVFTPMCMPLPLPLPCPASSPCRCTHGLMCAAVGGAWKRGEGAAESGPRWNRQGWHALCAPACMVGTTNSRKLGPRRYACTGALGGGVRESAPHTCVVK